MFQHDESVKSLKFNHIPILCLGIFFVLVTTSSVLAHASQMGLVLLLPTDVYIITGCLAVLTSILIVSFLPVSWMEQLMQPVTLYGQPYKLPEEASFTQSPWKIMTSFLALVGLLGLITVGTMGTRDPLANALPLFIWTVWWIAIVVAHGIFGYLWAWINPWTGLHALIFGGHIDSKLVQLPARFGVWPATLIYLCFSAFVIADPAPNDPSRLALIVLGYLVFTLLGMIVFGAKDWLGRCEGLTLMMSFLADLSPVKIKLKPLQVSIGLPGWRALGRKDMSFSKAIFVLVLIGSGSFDGVNETFWWLVQIGVNPLEFPGRSEVMTESVTGLFGANVLLVIIFSLSVRLGIRMTKETGALCGRMGFLPMFEKLALSVLPIALAYHATHYSISFLIDGQYVVAAMSDPLANGSNYLDLENYQVTTGFLNTPDSVRKIWLTQAGIIVAGHVLAVLMAHAVITGHFDDRRHALLCHIPIALFMTFYTWFGLWLLAAPKGG